jgi:Protein of unknown function (DUF2281)
MPPVEGRDETLPVDNPRRNSYPSSAMNTYAKTLPELLDTLPLELHDEVRDFVEFLLMKHQRRPGAKLRQDWGGALRDYRDQYTALALQEKSLDWRGD